MFSWIHISKACINRDGTSNFPSNKEIQGKYLRAQLNLGKAIRMLHVLYSVKHDVEQFASVEFLHLNIYIHIHS